MLCMIHSVCERSVLHHLMLSFQEAASDKLIFWLQGLCSNVECQQTWLQWCCATPRRMHQQQQMRNAWCALRTSAQISAVPDALLTCCVTTVHATPVGRYKCMTFAVMYITHLYKHAQRTCWLCCECCMLALMQQLGSASYSQQAEADLAAVATGAFQKQASVTCVYGWWAFLKQPAAMCLGL